MYSVVTEILAGILVVWAGVLSYFVWRDSKFLRNLFPQGEGADIRDRLNEVLSVIEQSERRDLILNKNLRGVAKEGLAHVQRVSLLRYNPYGDTGGDQSFSLALLDGNGKGLVLTSLHTRSGTRVYAKQVTNGQSELQLSKEESEVVKQALSEG